jgi:hypothetical protein
VISGYSKLKLLVPLALVLLYSLDFYYIIGKSGGAEPFFLTSDFMPTVVGARLIAGGDGGELYNLDAQLREQAQLLYPYYSVEPNTLLPYNHPPFEALAFTPFSALPYLWATLVWSAILLLCLWICARLMWRSNRAYPIGGLPWREPSYWIFLFVLSYYPVFRSLELGQNSIPVVLGLTLALVGLVRPNSLAMAIGLALTFLKPQIFPVMALAALLLGRWREVLGSLGIVAGLSVAAMPLLGWDWPLEYARLLVGVAGWESKAIDPFIMHNWRGFLSNTLGGVAPGLVLPLYLLLSALSVAALFVTWRRWRDATTVWAMGVLVAVLVSPHLNPHDLTLLILPGWVLAARGQWVLPLAGYLLAPAGHFFRLGGWWVVGSVLLTASAALYLMLRSPRIEEMRAGGDAPTEIMPSSGKGLAASGGFTYDALPESSAQLPAASDGWSTGGKTAQASNPQIPKGNPRFRGGNYG